MSLVLYPYVYLICRAVIANQIQHLTDIAQVLGLSGPKRFFRIVLPLVRPALVAGIGLAIMEALSDFGSVSFYGVPTFTTGIYRTWFNLGRSPVCRPPLQPADVVYAGFNFYRTLVPPQYSRRCG